MSAVGVPCSLSGISHCPPTEDDEWNEAADEDLVAENLVDNAVNLVKDDTLEGTSVDKVILQVYR